MEQLLGRSSRIEDYDEEGPDEDTEDDDETEIRIRRESGRIGFFGSAGGDATETVARRRYGSRTGSPDSLPEAEVKSERRASAASASVASPRGWIPRLGSLFHRGVFGTDGELDEDSGISERRPLLKSSKSFKIRVSMFCIYRRDFFFGGGDHLGERRVNMFFCC